MRRITQYFINAIASLAIFIVGIATGVMLMQQNPHSPNLTYLKTLNGNAAALTSQPAPQENGCPDTQQNTK